MLVIKYLLRVGLNGNRLKHPERLLTMRNIRVTELFQANRTIKSGWMQAEQLARRSCPRPCGDDQANHLPETWEAKR